MNTEGISKLEQFLRPYAEMFRMVRFLGIMKAIRVRS